MDLALYHPVWGFYAGGGAAGRRGDFLTSPEVGPLFGAVLARALDTWWIEMGRPDPFTVLEAGAGRGSLARSVLAAEPACRDVLRYVLVERSAALRSAHTDLGLESVEQLPDVEGPTVVVANELLDNLAFRLFERTAGGWADVRVGLDLIEVLVPTRSDLTLEPDAPAGARVPVQERAAEWVRTARSHAGPGGRVVAFDYAATTSELAGRPWTDWLRTYAGHRRGRHPLADLGGQDVTADVCVDQLPPPTVDRSQAEFLRAHGLDALVDDARRRWRAGAATGDLPALRARSRIEEARALADPTGLGGFRALEWHGT